MGGALPRLSPSIRPISGQEADQVVLEVVSKPPQGHEGEGEADEGLEQPRLALVTDEEASEVEEPGEGALHDPAPSIAAELSPVLVAVLSIAAVGNDEVDAALGHCLPQVA